MKSMKYLKNSLGMTLIEVLVAIGLFAIAAIPLLGVFHESVITNADSKIRTKEATIAQSIAEDIKAGNIKNNDDLKNIIFPEMKEGYFISVPDNPQPIGNGLMRYKFQVNYLNNINCKYTLYVVAPATSITAYSPPSINVPEGPPVNYRDITNIVTVCAWGVLVALLFLYRRCSRFVLCCIIKGVLVALLFLYPIVKLNLVTAFSIVFDVIRESIDWSKAIFF
ncbi:type IV pilus modification PilV family protein [Thermoanaerobacterium thermosaccharolyticum]|uniref:type IV pilus modification PilV family protein n=1 Tax=Thermoanaerobacterium thermosaccharolyticum TaxID=1517 RepID=UPI0020A39950|nr:prepilin-type N-terminal cleavage/methylation domain-containing protein [Thermoanaerobacterium thermosaccharolyticum]MCP2239333.1 prepilin-type N-terminal cleavage/methylation domain-containing protein [Thermoanaerobacterium thermosaccharolyticum]